MIDDQAHSKQFFGDSRDFWWNRDFLQLMASRWDLTNISKALDVGCGRGHWGQELSHVLPKSCSVFGVDPELRSIEFSKQRSSDRKLSDRFEYKVGLVEKLDFPDASFDLVTCQTVLIHVADPRKALKEMLRVLRPGGLIITVEPNNQANAMVHDSLLLSLEDHLEIVSFQARCERGKQKLGLGFNSLGDLIPGYFSEFGLQEIKVYISDKASPLFPPYASTEQQALKSEMIDWAKKGLYLWDKPEAWKYFQADGGAGEEFEILWEKTGKTRILAKDQLLKNQYHCAGGGIVYLISGRK